MRSAALALVLAVAAPGAMGCGRVREHFDDGFRASFRQKFAQSCTGSSTAKGVEEVTARPLCECMAKYLVDHQDPVALTRLAVGQGAAELQQVIGVAVQSCRAAAP
jgi:hypothetical protein